MAFSKKSAFETNEVALSEFAKVLAHPARVAILREVAYRQTCICGEIVEVLPLAQSTVSQHLKELTDVGLIDGTVDGAKSCYCINWAVMEQARALFGDFFDVMKLKKPFNCC